MSKMISLPLVVDSKVSSVIRAELAKGQDGANYEALAKALAPLFNVSLPDGAKGTAVVVNAAKVVRGRYPNDKHRSLSKWNVGFNDFDVDLIAALFHVSLAFCAARNVPAEAQKSAEGIDPSAVLK